MIAIVQGQQNKTFVTYLLQDLPYILGSRLILLLH